MKFEQMPSQEKPKDPFAKLRKEYPTAEDAKDGLRYLKNQLQMAEDDAKYSAPKKKKAEPEKASRMVIGFGGSMQQDYLGKELTKRTEAPDDGERKLVALRKSVEELEAYIESLE